jgi:hypothetical protein
MNFLLLDKFEDHSQFQQHCNEMSYDQKVRYLEFLEDNYPHITNGNYKLSFQSYNIQLLMEQSTEVVTRIFYIFHEYKDQNES